MINSQMAIAHVERILIEGYISKSIYLLIRGISNAASTTSVYDDISLAHLTVSLFAGSQLTVCDNSHSKLRYYRLKCLLFTSCLRRQEEGDKKKSPQPTPETDTNNASSL